MYDESLTIDQVLTRLREQPEAIATTTEHVPAAGLHRAPSPATWSVNDVLAHLRSCSDMWGGYIARIVREDHPTFRAVNPRTWIKQTNYPELEFGSSLKAFVAQRTELLDLLRHLPEEAWSRTATVTGAGKARERTVMEYATWLANHERTHVKQIARLVES
ncbi:MAG TPA: DinB family protein [Chloroflexota bacterium]|nr:DinB family protein [Chloroflexota bacterium]